MRRGTSDLQCLVAVFTSKFAVYYTFLSDQWMVMTTMNIAAIILYTNQLCVCCVSYSIKTRVITVVGEF